MNSTFNSALTKEALHHLDHTMEAFIKMVKKSSAIHKIKMQPFFGKDLWDNPEGVVTFRRPVQYMAVNDG